MQVVRKGGEYVQEPQGRIILSFIAKGEIDVGYVKHDMAAHHADVGGKRRLFVRIFHFGKNVKRGFFYGIHKLPELGIIVLQVRMAGHAGAWRYEVAVHLTAVAVLAQASDQQEVPSQLAPVCLSCRQHAQRIFGQCVGLPGT